MSKHIIIDWQRDGLFVAMGTRRGSNVTIDTLVTTKGGGDGAQGSSTAISTQLFALAKQLDLHKAEATIIAPREVLEFRTLTVPRGQSDEVPDMVRFQAHRQMANIGDTWPLDYILLPDQPGQEGISALAATISPAHMAEIEATCTDLGIHLTRVLARPLEIARWGVAVGNLADTEAGLIIAVSLTHADLLLVSRGSLIQVRGTRLPEDSAVMASTLVAEIRRSVMAAASYLNNQSVSKILLIAAPDLAERVESTISQGTGASVAIVDPASILPGSLPERHDLAHRSASRLAAIAGVIGNPAPDKRDVIDLKNCKRREPKKARTRETVLVAAVVSVLLLGGISWWWSTHATLNQEIEMAQTTAQQKKEQIEANIKLVKHRADVDKFLAGSINWLDEVAYVTAKLPPADQVMLSNPTLEVLQDNSGLIKVSVDSKDAQAINQMEIGLSDERHAVTVPGSKELLKKNGEYGWSATETIRITGNSWDPLAVPQKLRTETQPASKLPGGNVPAVAPAQSNAATDADVVQAARDQSKSSTASESESTVKPEDASQPTAGGAPAATEAKTKEPAEASLPAEANSPADTKQPATATPIPPAAAPKPDVAAPKPDVAAPSGEAATPPPSVKPTAEPPK